MSKAKSKAKPVYVKVHIEDDPTIYPPKSPYKFWLETDDSKVGKKKGKELTFANEGEYDGFDLTFEIENHTRKDFKFMDDGELPNGAPDPNCAPMWVKEVQDFGESCPDREFWDQFKTVSVTANNKRLHVRNENLSVQKFKFALMFSRNPQHGPCEIMYDPDGNNQNGPRPLTQ